MSDLEKIKAKYFAGEATEEEISQLLEQCKNDPSTLQELSEEVKTERLLSSLASNLELNAQEIIEQLENKSPDISTKVIDKIQKEKRQKVQIISFVIAAAAVLAFAFLLGNSKIATVQGNLEANWKFEEGQQLEAGPYSLVSGFTKLKFTSGAEVLIEGPAKFEILDNMHITLQTGKIVADIPPSAHGFKIDTPSSNTIDLGTKFAVAAHEDGSSEIHVLEGLVISKSKSATSYTELTKDEALQVNDSQNSTKLKADSGKFLTMLPPAKIADLKHILWRFDEGQGNIAKEESIGYEIEYNATLKTYGSKKPQWIEGKFGKAVKFDGKTNYVETDFPGIGGSNSRTVSFWIKADDMKENGYAIITWGSFEKFGATWQISLNPNSTDGPLGRIRCGTHKGQVIGVQDLRDNKWHHVAVVMYGGPEADVSTHILIYVDGKLENASRKSVRQIDTDIESETAVKVQMGKNAGVNFKNHAKHKFFRGALDEVYVFNYALNPEEIRAIIKNELNFYKAK